MRLRQFSEGAMEDTVRIIQKTFSPERKAVSDKILEIVRAVQMGKGDKMELARAITDITKSELEAKRSDPDLKVSTTQNLGMLKRAMDTVTGMSESITEEEIEEYKSIANLRNDSMFRSMAKLQDRKKPKEPEIKKVEPPQQLDLFKEDEKENAIEMRKRIADIRFDVAEIEDKISQLSEKDNGDLTDQITTMMKYSDGLYAVLSRAMKIVPVYEEYEESLTEEQFDEKAGEKDACYRKVKSRYKVWPSAYASGALTKCRKVGAANWGNSKKK